MKRTIIAVIFSAIALGVCAFFAGFQEGVEIASSGNHLTVDGQDLAMVLDKNEFNVEIGNGLVLSGKIRTVFNDSTRVTLKLTGSRKRSLMRGVDALPTEEEIATIVEDQVVALGAPHNVKLSIITLPLRNI